MTRISSSQNIIELRSLEKFSMMFLEAASIFIVIIQCLRQKFKYYIFVILDLKNLSCLQDQKGNEGIRELLTKRFCNFMICIDNIDRPR